jgi:hypothetical protein
MQIGSHFRAERGFVMRYVIPTLIALILFTYEYGRKPLVNLTLAMAEGAGEHQKHMLSLTQLNHALLGAAPHRRVTNAK